MKIETNVGALSPQQLFDHLDFACYRHNREGGMTAEDLAKPYLFGTEKGAALEKRYWQEISDYANAKIKRDQEVPQWLREARTGDPR